MTSPALDSRFPAGERPAFNTHLHLPPNFSAFETVEDAVETAAREDVRVIGSSNFHHFGVYDRFEAASKANGVAALFGLEFISVLEDEQRRGVKINDPANPGRAYVCGKGIPAPTSPSAATRQRIGAAKLMNETRAARMVELMRDLYSSAGLHAEISYASIAADVARRADVPTDWVVLQERHLALGFQELLFERRAPAHRAAFLERVFGGPALVAPDDAVAVQAELRSRLMKSACPAFVPETPIPFDDGLQLVLGLDGIPCYPTLADGVDPVCAFEDPPAALVERVLSHGIHAAELIPVRNRPEVVDEYVTTFREAGIFVLVGTEHNTQERIPVGPTCRGGVPLSPRVRDICWEGTCIVAAHQHLRASGEAGYVDGEGRLNPGFPDGQSRLRWFAQLGEEVLAETIMEASR